ncbi:MAG: GH92 family glycosyl hydrolase [Bacteroidales bacterium]|nr:GH92 family glycosyl hydrolase [Bacteroidales bacterium]
MKRKFVVAACVIAVFGTVCGCTGDRKDPVDYVNPYMGGISHLLVPAYPTVHLPNAMLRVYPERHDYTGDRIKGLPLIVTSHRGKSAFNLSFWQGGEDGLKPYYKYHYDNEKVKPYFYSVYCEDEEVEASFAPSYRSGIYEIGFSRDEAPYVIINAADGDVIAEGNSVKGIQSIDGNTKVCLFAEFAETPVKSLKKSAGRDSYVALLFPEGTEKVTMRYGVSFIDCVQAEDNMRKEISGKSLEEVASEGRAVWNEALGRIRVSGKDEDDKTVFYTSLYRTYERMICLTEYGRYYSAFDGRVHEDDVPFYTDDWVWDTYRAVHPLRILVEPEKETDMISSYIRMSAQMEDHWMPTFPEVTGDSRRMNSNHGVAFVADALAKGLSGFDVEKAYVYCKAGITEKTLAPWSGVKAGGLTEFYWSNGYIPALRDGEKEVYDEVHHFERRQPVAVTLGTAYDEWCLSRVAEALGNEQDYKYFSDGSYKYRNIFNPETLFFHPKDSDGNFLQPFDYVRSGGLGARNTYDENNGWIYRWDVPHNIADLISLFGGREKFVEELDRMFDTPLGSSKFEFFSQLPDHTGNVGQFSMANEPSMHIPYLYNYAGQPWKTQKRVRTLLRQWFRNDVMGIPGDEDGGGLSSFVVFSMLGFYPVTPGLPMYVIGSPVFEKAEVQLGNGNSFTVSCRNYAPENKYIQSASLDGKPFDRCWLGHDEISGGGHLEFVMGPRPNKEWAAGSVPPSFEIK